MLSVWRVLKTILYCCAWLLRTALQVVLPVRGVDLRQHMSHGNHTASRGQRPRGDWCTRVCDRCDASIAPPQRVAMFEPRRVAHVLDDSTVHRNEMAHACEGGGSTKSVTLVHGATKCMALVHGATKCAPISARR